MTEASGYARAILTNYHALSERQYVGDTDAICALLDLEAAVASAGLTERQAEALRLVYGECLTQKDAGHVMGISRQAAAAHVEKALTAIQTYYEKGRNDDDN